MLANTWTQHPLRRFLEPEATAKNIKRKNPKFHLPARFYVCYVANGTELRVKRILVR